jgi:hypothetical protein
VLEKLYLSVKVCPEDGGATLRTTNIRETVYRVPAPVRLPALVQESFPPNDVMNHAHYICAKCRGPVGAAVAWFDPNSGKQFHHSCLPRKEKK